MFGVFAGFYYWFPKRTGLRYSEALGKVHFWTRFAGVNITFFPRHFLGLAGRPRRIPDYPDAFAEWNAVASFGSRLSAFSALFFLWVIYSALVAGERVGRNPWNFR